MSNMRRHQGKEDMVALQAAQKSGREIQEQKKQA